MAPQQAPAAAAFFERSSGDDDDLENGNGFASELGEEAPSLPFYPVDDAAASVASAKAAAWAAAVPARTAALLSSSQLDALWAAVRGAATVFPTTARGGGKDSPSPSPSSSSDGSADPLSCREPALSTPPSAPDRLSLPSPRGPCRKVLTYAAYRRAAEEAARGGAGPAAAALLTARAFLRLAGRAIVGRAIVGGGRGEREEEGQEEEGEPSSPAFAAVVDAESLCDYLGQRAGQLQMHVHLSCFDADGGSGWLTEAGAAAFVRATLPQLARSGCADSFEGKLSLEDHAAIAARKLVFFHGKSGSSGSSRGGAGGEEGERRISSPSSGGRRLRIREVLAGRALAELLELAAPAAPASSSNDGDFRQQHQQQQAAANSPGGPPTNWFSAASAAAAAAAFASGAAAGVEAAAAAGLDLSEARVDFFGGRRRDAPASSAPPSVSAAEAAASGSLGIPAAALCELGDGTLSPLFAARLVEEKADARALVAVFPSGPRCPPPRGSNNSSDSLSEDAEEEEEEGEGEGGGEGGGEAEGESCSGDSENGEGEEGDEMHVDGLGRRPRRTRPRRRRRRRQPSPRPPSLSATAGLSLPCFLDFLLAWSDRGDPRSVAWLWPALDLRGRGQLTRTDVERLFEPVRRLWVERGQYEALRPSDVACEVFDIVVPDRPGFEEVITKKDLVKCTMAGTVIGLLCDVGCFYEHDSRELQLQQAALGTGDEEGDEEGEGEEEDGDGEFGRGRGRQEDLIVLDESKLDDSFSAAAAGDGGSSMAAAA